MCKLACKPKDLYIIGNLSYQMVKKITESDIISLFLNDYSRRIYLREAATELKKPHQSIKPYVKKLLQKKILLEKRRRKILEYTLNFKNRLVYDYIIIAEKNKMQSFLEENILIKTIYEKLSLFFNKNSFVLFGSVVQNPKKSSDIDLFVVGDAKLKKEIDSIEKVYSKKIHLIQVKKLEDVDISFVKEIYKKHIILNNTEKIIRFFGELHETNKLV